MEMVERWSGDDGREGEFRGGGVVVIEVVVVERQ